MQPSKTVLRDVQTYLDNLGRLAELPHLHTLAQFPSSQAVFRIEDYPQPRNPELLSMADQLLMQWNSFLSDNNQLLHEIAASVPPESLDYLAEIMAGICSGVITRDEVSQRLGVLIPTSLRMRIMGILYPFPLNPEATVRMTPFQASDVYCLDEDFVRAVCKNRPQRKTRATVQHWTIIENSRVVELISLYRDAAFPILSRELRRRTETIRQHFHRVLDPMITKGRWTEEEDRRLVALVQRFGERAWRRVAEYMTGRCDVQCRYRYKKGLRRRLQQQPDSFSYDAQFDPHSPNQYPLTASFPRFSGTIQAQTETPTGFSSGPWSAEENQRLIDAVRQHGPGVWTEISSIVGSRSPSQCLRHYQRVARRQTAQSSEARSPPIE